MTAPEHSQASERARASLGAVAPEQGARYLTIEELSSATTLSVSTIRRLVKKGLIVGHQPGGPRHRIVFSPDVIEQASKVANPSKVELAPNTSQADTSARPQRGPQPRWFGNRNRPSPPTT